MFIEVNLVGNDQIVFANLFDLRARKRYQVQDDAEAMAKIVEFLKDNISVIDATIADKSLVTRLQSIETLSINDFLSLKFILAQSGIDILAYTVAEEEVNPELIDNGIYEYNIVDVLYPENSFLRRATKVAVSQESSHLSDVYKRIQEIYEFFESDLLSDYKNPISAQIDTIKQTEELIGRTPDGLTTFVNSVFEYMGKQIILITAERL